MTKSNEDWFLAHLHVPLRLPGAWCWILVILTKTQDGSAAKSREWLVIVAEGKATLMLIILQWLTPVILLSTHWLETVTWPHRPQGSQGIQSFHVPGMGRDQNIWLTTLITTTLRKSYPFWDRKCQWELMVLSSANFWVPLCVFWGTLLC